MSEIIYHTDIQTGKIFSIEIKTNTSEQIEHCLTIPSHDIQLIFNFVEEEILRLSNMNFFDNFLKEGKKKEELPRIIDYLQQYIFEKVIFRKYSLTREQKTEFDDFFENSPTFKMLESNLFRLI